MESLPEVLREDVQSLINLNDVIGSKHIPAGFEPAILVQSSENDSAQNPLTITCW